MNPQLQLLMARETAREILACLTPRQMAVVALALDGISYAAAAELLGITQQTAYERMKVARVKVRKRFPESVRSRVWE